MEERPHNIYAKVRTCFYEMSTSASVELGQVGGPLFKPGCEIEGIQPLPLTYHLLVLIHSGFVRGDPQPLVSGLRIWVCWLQQLSNSLKEPNLAYLDYLAERVAQERRRRCHCFPCCFLYIEQAAGGVEYPFFLQWAHLQQGGR